MSKTFVKKDDYKITYSIINNTHTLICQRNNKTAFDTFLDSSERQ